MAEKEKCEVDRDTQRERQRKKRESARAEVYICLPEKRRVAPLRVQSSVRTRNLLTATVSQSGEDEDKRGRWRRTSGLKKKEEVKRVRSERCD